MKKTAIIIAGAVLLALGSIAVAGSVSRNTGSTIFEDNVEALTSGETSKEGFNTVLKIESSHTLICRGSGNLECTW